MADTPTPSADEGSTPRDEPSTLRGLWRLMGRGNDAPTAAADERAENATQIVSESDAAHREKRAEVESEPAPAEDRAVVGGKGLWGVMRGSAPVEPAPRATPPASEPGGVATRAVLESPSLPADDEILELPAVAAREHVEQVSDDALSLPETARREVPRAPAPGNVEPSAPTRRSLHCLVTGGASVVLSALAMVPSFWAQVPSTVLGFAALLLGMTAWNEIRRSRGRKRGTGLVAAGVLCGAAGIVLGPAVFARLGAHWRAQSGQSVTIGRLSRIGAALGVHQDETGAFPAGGIFERDEMGRERPMHGWMTAVLPYLGEGALHGAIDLSRPYDDPSNREPMSRRVPAYLAAGGDPRPLGNGMAPAHFAGVGGEVSIPGEGLARLGVFGRDSAVRREDVADGLSQTLIAGEIAHLYPAWGEPENWRAAGKGLNTQSRGFGNADGTGALFLKADGSVQFFSNQTPAELLQRLSTRDGGEPVADDSDAGSTRD